MKIIRAVPVMIPVERMESQILTHTNQKPLSVIFYLNSIRIALRAGGFAAISKSRKRLSETHFGKSDFSLIPLRGDGWSRQIESHCSAWDSGINRDRDYHF